MCVGGGGGHEQVLDPGFSIRCTYVHDCVTGLLVAPPSGLHQIIKLNLLNC